MRFPSEETVTIQTLTPVVITLLEVLTPKEGKRLAAGKPDRITTCFLFKTMRDILEIFTSNVLEKLQKENFTTEDIKAIVGNKVPDTFAKILNIEGDYSTEHTKNINQLIVKHVMNKVISSLDFNDPRRNHIKEVPYMYTMKNIVSEASLMIRDLVIFHSREKSKKVAVVNTVESKSKFKGQKERIKTFLGKRTQKHSSELAPVNTEPERQETSSIEVKPRQSSQVLPGEDALPEKESGVTLEEQCKPEDEGKKQFLDLLTYCLIGRAIEASGCSGSLEVVNATNKRLSEKVWAEVHREEIHGDPKNISICTQKIFEYLCKALGKSSRVVGSLLLSQNAELDKTVVAAFLKCLRKPVGKSSLVKRFFRGLGKALKKTTFEKSVEHVQSPRCKDETTWDETEDSAVEEICSGDHAGVDEAPSGSGLRSPTDLPEDVIPSENESDYESEHVPEFSDIDEDLNPSESESESEHVPEFSDIDGDMIPSESESESEHVKESSSKLEENQEETEDVKMRKMAVRTLASELIQGQSTIEEDVPSTMPSTIGNHLTLN